MLRAVERVLGDGVLFEGDQRRLRVGYELTCYQEWRPVAGTLTPGEYVVEGQVLAFEGDLATVVGTPLTLHLDDGRRVELVVTNAEGEVGSTDGRGLYRPD